MDQIRQAMREARAQLEGRAEEGRHIDSEAVAELTEGLRVTITGPAGEAIVTDMPQGFGGGGSAPSPGWLLRAAVAGCTTSLIAMRAAQIGVVLSRVQVSVTSKSNDRGILAVGEGVPAGPLSMRVVVRLDADGVDRPQLETIARWGMDHCPVADAVQRPVPVELLVEPFSDAAA